MIKQLTMIALLGLTSCISELPTREYKLGNTTIVCASHQEVNRKFNAHPLRYFCEPIEVDGFNSILENKIYVQWGEEKDKDGLPLPDFSALGHEVWHNVRWDFHDTTNQYKQKGLRR